MELQCKCNTHRLYKIQAGVDWTSGAPGQFPVGRPICGPRRIHIFLLIFYYFIGKLSSHTITTASAPLPAYWSIALAPVHGPTPRPKLIHACCYTWFARGTEVISFILTFLNLIKVKMESQGKKCKGGAQKLRQKESLSKLMQLNVRNELTCFSIQDLLPCHLSY